MCAGSFMVMPDSGLARLLSPWNSLGKNTLICTELLKCVKNISGEMDYKREQTDHSQRMQVAFNTMERH